MDILIGIIILLGFAAPFIVSFAVGAGVVLLFGWLYKELK